MLDYVGVWSVVLTAVYVPVYVCCVSLPIYLKGLVRVSVCHLRRRVSVDPV